MDQPKKKRNTWKRAVRIVLKTILFLFLFFVLVVVLILTPPVQNFLRKKTVAYLENKLHTRVEVGRIYIGLPKKIVLEDIYVEDRQQDTLLSGGSVKVNMAILKLIFKNQLDIRSIQLEDITAKIKRQLPDTAFNFQFIVDAFSPAADTTTVDTTAASPIAIRSITLDRSRVVYKDVVTGNDAEMRIEHFATRVDKFDPEKLIIDIPSVNIKGLVARIYQTNPLEIPDVIPDPASTPASSILPVIDLGKISLADVNVDYRNDVTALYTNASIRSLDVETENMDFAEQVMAFKNISLTNTTAALRFGKKETAKELAKQVVETGDSSLERGWRFEIASFVSENNHLQFDNDNLPAISPAKNGASMDYAHLAASPFNLEAKDILISEDSIAGQVEKASFKEKSGFELQELSTRFFYSENQSFLQDLYLKTPGSELKRSAAIRYASLQALENDVANLYVDMDIEQSRILVKDVLTFAPMLRTQPAFADPAATWYIHSRIHGRIADLSIEDFRLQGLQDTRIDIAGRIAGLPDMDRFSANLAIRNISSSRRDIQRFIPTGMLPANITLPSRFTITGNANGNTNDLNTSLAVRTDLGNVTIKGKFSQPGNPDKIGYNAVIAARSVNLGTILQDPQNLGPLSATFAINGTGIDPATVKAMVKGNVHSIIVKQYEYRNLDLEGTLDRQEAVVDAVIIDPNLHVTLHASGNIAKENPPVTFSAMIDSIKTEPLHLSTQPIIYRGKIEGHFTSADPDRPEGTIHITQSLLVQNEQRLTVDTLQVLAARTDSGHSIRLASNILTAELQGQYQLTQLGGVFQRAIEPYFSITSASLPSVTPYDFTLNADVVNSLPLQAFVPGLERMDSLNLQSRFSNAGWNATVTAPVIDYTGYRIRGLLATGGTDDDSIRADLAIRQISSSSINLFATTLHATLANNQTRFTTDTKDKAGKTRYHFSGLFNQPQQGQYNFSFVPEGLLLNYETWTVPANNRLVITDRNITASDFVLTKGTEQLNIHSANQGADAPLQVQFKDFQLATITAFVQTDSTLVNGNMNGLVAFTNIMNDPVFEGNLTIADLSIRNDTVGNAVIRVNNAEQNIYAANVTLSGRGNDVRLDGKYFARGNGNSSFEMDLNIINLPMTTAVAFSGGAIRSASGNTNGRFTVTGTMDRPVIRGDLNFDRAGFAISTLNSYFIVDKESIRINETGIVFDRFEISDSLNNRLVLNGTAATSNFMNYQFDFTIRANNFQALNSTKKDNNLFYGQLFFSSNLSVKGTDQTPVIDGRITINENTKMTVVLPQREPGIVEREGVIEFVDMDAPLNDSLFLAAYDSLNTTSLRGLDVTANIEVNKEAQFNLVIDEGNGDFLNVRGEASLNAGIDPSGKLTLAGSYELEEGSYELTFNFIRRKFNIQKGSKIIWLGEPTDADLDITAIYTANTSPLDLVKNQLGENITATQRNTYLQKIPFDIMLFMNGKLLKPEITFDIKLPEDRNYRVGNEILVTTRNKLDQLRQEPGEMNKQVFAVLLLNRFIGENPFNSSSETIDANMLARQSVSKLLTEQLNRLAGDLIEGVDLNFDVISSEDYTTGERRDRTDLNVGLSKQLLSDRLTVSVGSNFELEGPQNSSQRANNIAGNVALNYRVSSDGRYVLRAYRKNEYEGIIDGYIIETGVSFIISVDYNRFRQIFLSKEQRQKRRENRQAARLQRREQTDQVIQEEKQP